MSSVAHKNYHPNSSDSDISSFYSTILSSDDTDHDEVNNNLNSNFEFPRRNPVEFYQIANPYANSLWCTGDKGADAIGKIQERVKTTRKRVAEELALPTPPRNDSLNKNKKVDSPIKNDHFTENFETKYFNDSIKTVPAQKIPETKYRKALKELLETEIKYHDDLELVNSIYRSFLNNSKKYKNILNKQEQAVIFGNIDTIIDLSQLLIKELTKAIKKEMPGGPVDYTDVRDLIAYSSVENIDIGELFDNQLNRFKISYTSYFQNHRNQLQELISCNTHNGPKVSKWLIECAFLAKSRSECLDFESLLIKPIQRLTKYPLLIDALINNSCDDISFKNIQKLCDSKDHLERLLEMINSVTSQDATSSDLVVDKSEGSIAMVTTKNIDRLHTREKYTPIVMCFKERYLKLKGLRLVIVEYLPYMLKFIDDHVRLAKSWKTFLEQGESELDDHYMKSIYSIYCEKLSDQRSKTLLAINGLENTVVKALDMGLELCETTRSTINKHGNYRAAYIASMNKEKSPFKIQQQMQAKGRTYKDAQTYIEIENQIIDEVPILNEKLDSLMHKISLAYHKGLAKWLKTLAGEKSIEQFQECVSNGTFKIGNNFDIVELHIIAKHHTRLALEEFKTKSINSYSMIYGEKSTDQTRAIYSPSLLRRLFGNF